MSAQAADIFTDYWDDRRAASPLEPEQRLFAEVIVLAFHDAMHGKDAIRREAIQWFEDGGRDYRLVCDLAGVADAEALREGVLAKIDAQQAARTGAGAPIGTPLMPGHLLGGRTLLTARWHQETPPIY